ncbi:hypothetical protein OG21DRAFT_785423 [Imleria badia]|nr:hypothetical protein OG21DRAFT_785423 [Imleria badia]
MASPPTSQRKSTLRSRVGVAIRRSSTAFSIPGLPNRGDSATPPPPQDSDTAGSVSGKLDREDALNKIDTASPQVPLPVSGAPSPIAESPAREAAALAVDPQPATPEAIEPDSDPDITDHRAGTAKVSESGSEAPQLEGSVLTNKPSQSSLHPQGSLENEVGQPLASGDHDNKPPNESNSEEPRKSGSVGSKSHSDDGDSDLLNIELPSSKPTPRFNYDEPPSSTTSTHAPEVEVLPRTSSLRAIPLSSDVLPVVSPSEAPSGECHDTTEPSQTLSVFKRWLQSRSASTGDTRSRSQSPTRAITENAGPSRYSAGKRQKRAVWKSTPKPMRQPLYKTPVPTHPNKDSSKDASHSGKGAADPKEADLAQQANDGGSEPSIGSVRVTVHVVYFVRLLAYGSISVIEEQEKQQLRSRCPSGCCVLDEVLGCAVDSGDFTLPHDIPF